MRQSHYANHYIVSVVVRGASTDHTVQSPRYDSIAEANGQLALVQDAIASSDAAKLPPWLVVGDVKAIVVATVLTTF